jgi:saxitoxin biosynthesis operon SxtJ-like protein
MKLLDVNLNPDARTLRRFGFVALAVFGALGGVVLWRHSLFGIDLAGSSAGIAHVLWAAGGASALFSLFAPRLNRFLYRGLMLAGIPIGFVLSYIFMGLIFYAIITPVGLVFRLFGRDPLRRKFDSKLATYWVDHQEPESVERYFKQY